MKAWIAVALMSGCCLGGESYRLTIEAEDFDNLAVYGNWIHEKGLGWYVKEHRHASGRAFVVCDAADAGAEMSKRLQQPIPAGDVKVFLNVVLMRVGPGNSVEVALGNLEDAVFVPTGATTFKWALGSGYSWFESKVSTKKPSSVVRIKAVEIQCKGIGDVPEEPGARVILDSICLTDNPDAKVVAGRMGRGMLVFPQPPAQETEGPKPVEAPKPKLPKGNLLPDGSFEYGHKPPWLHAVDMYHAYDTTILNLDTTTKVHGLRSLRLTATPKSLLEVPVENYGANVVSAPFPIEPNKKYQVGFWAKASKDGIVLTAFGLNYGLTTEWKQYRGELLSKEPTASVLFAFQAKAPETVWLDAIVVAEEVGDSFRAPDDFEVGLLSKAVAQVYYDDEPVEFDLVATNTSEKTRKAKVSWKVFDTLGRVVAAGSEKVKAEAGKVEARELDTGLRRRGSFLAFYEAEGKTGRMGFAVVPNPKTARGKKPFIGTYSNSTETAMLLYQRAGFDWQTTLNDRILRADLVSTAPDQYKFYDHLVKKWGEYGIEFVGETVPSEPPRWDKAVAGTEVAARAASLWFSHEAWRHHLETLLSHYNYVKYWILTDEAENQRAAVDYAPYVKIAYEEAKRRIPDSKVMFSASADMMEEVYKILGTAKVQDIFGGSRFGGSKWHYMKDRDFIDKYRLPTWHIGVGYPTYWLYELYGPDGSANQASVFDLNRRLNAMAWDLILQTAICEPDRYCHYTGKLDGGRDPYTFFNEDSTFKPHAIQWVNTLQFLRGAKRGECEQVRPFIEACFFERLGEPYAVLNASGPRADWRLTIAIPSQNLEVYDRDMNPLKPDREGKTTELVLWHDNLRILKGKGIDLAALSKGLRNLEAEAEFFQRPFVVPGEKGAEFAVGLVGKRGFEGEIRAMGKTQKLRAKAGKPKLVRFELPENLRHLSRPLVYYPIGYEIVQEDGSYLRDAPPLWAFGAPYLEKKPTLDGKLDEWKQSPINLYVSPSLDGSYQMTQAALNGHRIQGMKDLSARIWAGWDDENLYLAADVMTAYADSCSLTLFLSAAEPELWLSGGRQKEDFRVHGAKENWYLSEEKLPSARLERADGFSVEMSVLWQKIGGKRDSLGLSLKLVEEDGSVCKAIAWPDENAATGDRQALGQLILLGR